MNYIFCCVDVRHCYLDLNDGLTKPTKREINVNKNEFYAVKSLRYTMYAMMMHAQKHARVAERMTTSLKIALDRMRFNTTLNFEL